MKIAIEKSVFSKFPQLQLMVFVANGVHNKEHLYEVQHLVAEAARLTQLTHHKNTLKNHYLIAPWVIHQRAFGAKGHAYHTSVEVLIRKVLHKKPVVAHNVLTNILRYLTLRYLVPIGHDDLDKVNGNITFGIARGTERVGLLLRVEKGALYYRDSKRVLGTKLDHWKSPKTAVHQDTSRVLFHVICIPPIDQEQEKAIAKDMHDLLRGFCGAKVQGFVLSAKKPSVMVQ